MRRGSGAGASRRGNAVQHENLLVETWAAPGEVVARCAVAVDVVDLDLVRLPRGKLDLPLHDPPTMVVFVEDELSVEPEPQGTVAVAVEHVRPRGRGDQASRPADREVVLADPGRGIRQDWNWRWTYETDIY